MHEEVLCAAPSNITNGEWYPNQNIYRVGDSIEYVCFEGYKLIGNNTAVCTYSGGWNYTPICKPIETLVEETGSSQTNLIVGMIALGAGIPLILLVSFTTIYALRHRKTLAKSRAMLSLKKRKKVYDAFVSYNGSGSDQEFVRKYLWPALEMEAHPPFRLLFHERDFKADTLILTNIMNAIRNSNAAIIIMSQEYVNADWCREEFQECVEESKKDPAHKLLVILMQPLETLQNCTDHMEQYFRHRTFLDKHDSELSRKLVENL